jgi:hypothetical protein
LAEELEKSRRTRVELGARVVHPVVVDVGADELVTLVQRGERAPLTRSLPALESASRWRIYQDEVPVSGVVPGRLLASVGVATSAQVHRGRRSGTPSLSVTADNRVVVGPTGALRERVGLSAAERMLWLDQAREEERSYRRARATGARVELLERWVAHAERLLAASSEGASTDEGRSSAALAVLAPLVQAVTDARACMSSRDDALIERAELAFSQVLDELPGDIAEGIRGDALEEPSEEHASERAPRSSRSSARVA